MRGPVPDGHNGGEAFLSPSLRQQQKGGEPSRRIASDAAGAYWTLLPRLVLRGVAQATHLKSFTRTRSSAVLPASLV